MALSDTTDQTNIGKAPFFSTALGHGLASIGATVLLAVVSKLISDPTLAGAFGITGAGYTILTIIRLLLDPTVPNLPSSR